MKALFHRERKHQALFSLSVLCILLVLGCLITAAGMGMGLVSASAVKMLGVAVLVGLLVMAALRLLLEALAAKQASAGSLHAPEMSTLTFPPPAVSPRRGCMVRIK